MKLLNPGGCWFSLGGGNVKQATMIVEGQGMGFWTRVRLPSIPLKIMIRRQGLTVKGWTFSSIYHDDNRGSYGRK